MIPALTFWPEWCPTFPGVLFADGQPSRLNKGVENRLYAPWSTIAPTPNPLFSEQPTPGSWFAMHAGAQIGGRPNNDGALINVVDVAATAGWTARRRGDVVVLSQGEIEEKLSPDRIIRSAIVAVVRITHTERPGVEGLWRIPGQWGWYLEVRPLTRPVPCKGAQGLWTPPTSVCADVQAQLFGGAL